MGALDDLRIDVTRLRKARAEVRAELEAAFEQLVGRPGGTTPDELTQGLARFRDRLGDLRRDEAARLDEADPRAFVATLDGSTPILLAPLHVQTRFVGAPRPTHLRVRVYPDAISVQSHDPGLTDAERQAGSAYWEAPETVEDGESRPTRDAIGAGLDSRYGSARAAWIRRATAPGADDPGTASAARRSPATWTLPDRLVFRFFGPDNRLLLEEPGRPIADGLEMGFDPTRPDAGFARSDDKRRVRYPDEVRWQYEFEAAVDVGLAIEVPLARLENRTHIDRVVVVGVRLSSDENASSALLEQLVADHKYAAGFSLVPQGTPTNIVDGDEAPAPPTEEEIARAFDAPVAYDEAADGVRLAHALGLPIELMRDVPNAAITDGRDAIAMRRALWSGTLGYFAQQMLSPIFDDTERVDQRVGQRLIAAARFFFTNFVFGRGPLPALRVGDQPYGLLPVSGDMLEPRADGVPPWEEPFFDGFVTQLHQKLIILARGWIRLAPQVARAGAGADADKRLLDVLGLQPSSAEFYTERLMDRDYVESYADFRDPAAGKAAFEKFNDSLDARVAAFQNSFPGLLPGRPRIFDLSFFGSSWRQVMAGFQPDHRFPTPLNGDVIDELPPSERRRLAERGVYPNYLAVLGGDDFDAVRDGLFRSAPAGQTPAPLTALLYLAARHSYLYEAAYGAMRLANQLKSVRWAFFREAALRNVRFELDRTYWDLLDVEDDWEVPEAALRRASTRTLLTQRNRLRDMSNWSLLFGDMDELQRACAWLSTRPTAALRRLFTEHLDLASYRLDAWITGFVFERLLAYRYWHASVRGNRHVLYPRDGGDRPFRLDMNRRPIERVRRGIFLGAYGWVERVDADGRRTPVDDVPEALRPDEGEGAAMVTRDPDNVGLIQAPSLNHAVTAAILRSASVTQPDTAAYNIDLSSARVRGALDIIDGVRNGQPPAALLGYLFERGLRDSAIPEAQQYIPALRTAFPMPKPGETAAEPAETIPARDVVNGLRIVQALAAGTLGDGANSAIAFVPAGPVRMLIRELAEGLRNRLDACGDLMLAESVHHAAMGNMERATGAVSAAGEFSHLPDEFHVVQTPRSGSALTHRVLIALDASAPPGDTPRSRLAPALDRFIGDTLGPLSTFAAQVRFEFEDDGDAEYRVRLDALGLSPIDIVYALEPAPAGATQTASGELNERLARAARPRLDADHGNRAVAQIVVSLEADAGAGRRPAAEIAPLAAALRALSSVARGATRRDFVATSTLYTPGADADAVDLDEIQRRVTGQVNGAPATRDPTSLVGSFDAAHSALADAEAALVAAEAAAADPANPAPPSTTALKALADSVRDALSQASLFGLPQALAPWDTSTTAPLHATATATLALMTTRRADAKRALNPPADVVTPGAPPDVLSRVRKAADALLGSSVPVLPRVTLPDPLESAEVDLAARPATGIDVDDWLFVASSIREGAARLQHTRVLAEALTDALPALRVFQWPTHDAWVADPLPASELTVDVAAIVVQPGNGFAPDAAFVGLVVDEWHEVVPRKRETTGVTFHYDAPNAEPPQSLLLAVSARRPLTNLNWSWEELTAAVDQAFVLAVMRAVEPDRLRTTALDTVLPATLTAEVGMPTTIGTSWLANTVKEIAEAQAASWTAIRSEG